MIKWVQHLNSKRAQFEVIFEFTLNSNFELNLSSNFNSKWIRIELKIWTQVMNSFWVQKFINLNSFWTQLLNSFFEFKSNSNLCIFWTQLEFEKWIQYLNSNRIYLELKTGRKRNRVRNLSSQWIRIEFKLWIQALSSSFEWNLNSFWVQISSSGNFEFEMSSIRTNCALRDIFSLNFIKLSRNF